MRHIVLVVCLLCWPGGAHAQALPEDLAQVPADAMGFVHVRTADMWASPMFKMYRDVLPKAGAEALAILEGRIAPSLSSIDRLTVSVSAPSPEVVGRNNIIAILHTSQPLDEKKVVAGLQEVKKGDLTFYPMPPRTGGYLRIISKNTLIMGSLDSPAIPANNAQSTWLAAALAKAATGKNMMLGGMTASAVPPQIFAQWPPVLQPFTKATSAVIGLDLGKEWVLDLDLGFASDDQAKQAEGTTEQARAMGNMLLKKAKQELDGLLATAPASVPLHDVENVAKIVGPVFGLAFVKRGEEILAGIPVTRRENHLSAKLVVPEELTSYASSAPILVALLLPAVQKVREAASRTHGANNLKQIGLAMHSYHDVYRHFPSAAICDKAGKPLLSWRVAILPYIEEDNLYRKFKLDEPWDSEHNIKLLPLMPATYKTPGIEELGKTRYRVLVGPDQAQGSALFRTPSEKVSFRQITDGTSNTIFTVETEASVPWTKPEEVTYDPKGPLPKLHRWGRIAYVGYCDGSVRTLSDSAREQDIRAAITRNAGDFGNLDD